MTAPSAPTAATQGVNLRSLLEEMIERGASDLHITAGERPKLRIDGDITNSNVEYMMQPKDTMQLAYSVLTENQKKRFEMEDELDFSFGIQNSRSTASRRASARASHAPDASRSPRRAQKLAMAR